MKTIEIKIVPHARQRYDTVGDYEMVDFNRKVDFRVSAMSDWRSEAAVAVHELIEYFLVTRARIKLAVVDEWDFDHPDAEEPGDVPDCPYALQHRFAENIERLVVAQLGLTWAEHEENCDGVATRGLRRERSRRAGGGVRGAGAGLADGPDRLVRDGAGADAPLDAGEAAEGAGSVRGPLEGAPDAGGD